MYNKVSTSLSFVEREKETLEFWKKQNIFEKSIKMREHGPVFTFFDGPPTANGKPHIGHILTRAIKDIIPRYKTMKGYKVLRKAGWDTHGLPVELEVEKMLGISGKPDIEKYGIEPFIKECKQSVWKYESLWRDMSDRVGFWADMDNPYVTYKNDYIESVWWALKQISDKGLIYKGHRVVPYCPRCGTSLSTHEVAQGYKDVKEKSAIAKFKLIGEENTFFLAWTTTPWTLPSNLALCVNPKESYAKVSVIAGENGDENTNYILAENLITTVLGEETPFTIIQKYTGSELENLEYEPLFEFTKNTVDKKAFFVTCDPYVTLTDGTGIVHIAPAFGEDDSRIGKKYKLPFLQLVDSEGNMTKEATPFAGVFVKDADPLILKALKESGKLFKVLNYEHNYPFCWRCDTPLLYYAREAWFIEMTKVRDLLVANNKTVNWIPENIGTGRFGNFLENVHDWSLSRERYWGTPLPIWECSCGHRHTIGSIEELRTMGGTWDGELELHKPYIDNVLLDCPKCSQKMKRVSEVIDCWFDSGAMPFAQWHYPFENKELFEENFPANFISEAIDQTRGWFYTLMAISTLLFEKSPYKNVVVLGHVQDKNGVKMSKHTGNVVDPWEVLDKQGADAVRWYFYSGSAPWLPSRFSEEAVSEGQSRFMGTLWNTYYFYILYANIDNFNPYDYTLDKENLPIMDKWILSKLNTLVTFVDNCLDNYKLTESSRAITDFLDELSNWYVRRSRERFWVSDMPQDKINAYMTLFTTLETVTRLSAPYTPFIADNIYKNLVGSVNKNALESVHLTDFPTADETLIDKDLENAMKLVLDIVVAGRSARQTANIKNRQPIGNMFVKLNGQTLPEAYHYIILEELNVKSITFIDDAAAYIGYKFKPQLKTLGPKYGKLLGKISAFLSNVDGNSFMDKLKAGTVIEKIGDEQVELTLADVLPETAQKDGYCAENGKQSTVVLETTLSPTLIEEGFVREVISKIQTMRKEANFEVLDKINISIITTDTLKSVIERNLEEIKSETLTNSLDLINPIQSPILTKEWLVNNEQATFSVNK